MQLVWLLLSYKEKKEALKFWLLFWIEMIWDDDLQVK